MIIKVPNINGLDIVTDDQSLITEYSNNDRVYSIVLGDETTASAKLTQNQQELLSSEICKFYINEAVTVDNDTIWNFFDLDSSEVNIEANYDVYCSFTNEHVTVVGADLIDHIAQIRQNILSGISFDNWQIVQEILPKRQPQPNTSGMQTI